MTARRPTGDGGNALVEFTYLAVLLMVPLVYVLLAGFQVQRAAFGATEAARQAGRAYARADSTAQGQARADAAARLAMTDQGITDSSPPVITCLGGACLGPVDGDNFAHARCVHGFDDLIVDPDVPFVDEPLNRAARDGGVNRGEKFIEPLAGQRVFDGEGFRALGHCPPGL